MSGRRRAPRRRRVVVLQSALALVAVGALTVSTLTLIESDRVPVVADLGKAVAGHSATDVETAGTARSSRSTAVPTEHLGHGSWTVALHGAAAGVTTSGPKGSTAARVRGSWSALGSSSITVAAATRPGTGTAAVKELSVSVPTAKQASKRHLPGMALTLTREDAGPAAPVAVRIPRSLLARQFGADYASRTRWVQVDDGKALSARTMTPVATTTSGSDLVMTPRVAARAVTLAATSAPVSSNGAGTFSASPLKEAGSWDVSAQTGDFSWQYPMDVPDAPAGPTPDLSLTYDSQSVDGETGSTNNQPSAVGEGWELGGGGFIERQYVSCSQDDGPSGAVKTSGDQCWKTDNATISLNGHATALVKDRGTGTWRMKSDDGSRIEHLVGTGQGCSANGTYDTDCWRVTTADGTQYYFGKNQLPGWTSGKATTNSAWTVPVFGNDSGEPCHASTFAASSCVQAWRWNLDYVVDVHGNAEALYYSAESNSYGKNGSGATSYVRGGQLEHIDYGLTASTVYTANAATGRVTFGYDAYGRCNDTTHANCTKEAIGAAATKPAKPTAYPDVPWDQFCTASCTANPAPTFWTDGMLTTVTTAVKTGTAYATVDKWALSHSFPDPGDGTTAALWMTQVQHTGYAGSASITEPATKFSGVTKQNRVWAVDGLAPLDKYRISAITAETGAVTSVTYSGQDCTPAEVSAIEAAAATNTRRCYPQWWTPSITPPQEAKLDLFHKYVVTKVVDDPKTGGGNDRPRETQYAYTGTPAWKYNTSVFTPEKKRTWSVFAGYDKVEVRDGDSSDPSAQKTTAYTFYRGLDGDRAGMSGGTKTVTVTDAPGVADSPWFAGQVRDTTVRNGVGGPVLSDTVNTPWTSDVAADDGTNQARRIEDGTVHVSEPTADGRGRTTDTTTTYDDAGDPVRVSTATSDAGATCTTTSYAPSNTDAWIIGLPVEEKTVGLACGTAPATSNDIVSDTRTSYDGAALGAAPTKGDATKVETVTGFAGGVTSWTTTASTKYDALGRAVSVTDALGRTTSTAYTPASGGPVTATTVTNPKGWKSTTTIDPARGSELTETDVAGDVTSATYDALGRRTQVWLPGHPKASFATSPSTTYAYTETQTAPLAVATTRLNWGGTTTAYVLYDGLGQQVQTQDPSGSGGSVVTDTWYDAQGRVSNTNNAYWASGTAPSAKLFLPVSQQQIQSAVAKEYDAAGRVTAEVTSSYGKEQYRTTSRYQGADQVDVTPPQGGTPTSTTTDSFGHKRLLRQYLGGVVAAGAAHQDTTYGYDGRGDMTEMRDPAGNTWSWTFDPTGDMTAQDDPDSGRSTFTYDPAGNRVSSTDARGVLLTTAYDDLDRKTDEYAGATGGALLAHWDYDTVKRGELSTSTAYRGSVPGTPGSAVSTTITGYDGADQPTGKTVTIGAGAPAFAGTTYTTKTTYNQDETVATVTMPAAGGLAAERLSYTYDALGAPSSIAGTKSYAGVVRDALNRVAQVDRDGTVANTSAYTRDAVTGDVVGIQDQTGTGSSTVVQAKRTYTRNAIGTVTSVQTTGAAGSETQCYSYDAVQELTEAWTPATGACGTSVDPAALGGPAPYWHSYRYDLASGNRTRVTTHSTSGGADQTATYTYPAAGTEHPHAVQSVVTDDGVHRTTDAFAYDEAGDTTSARNATLAYDEHGKLSATTVGAQRQDDVYDADGQLLIQVDPQDGATLFLGDTELRRADDGSSVTATRTYAIAGITVAERDTKSGTSTVYALDTDIDGNADLQSDVLTGAVTRRWFTPFGESRGEPVAWTSAHGFLNKAASAFSGLTQLGARAYDATLGRFLSVDAVLAPDNPQQNNGYAYSGSNPITFTDPSGDCYMANDRPGGYCVLGSRPPTATNPYYHPTPPKKTVTKRSYTPPKHASTSSGGRKAPAATKHTWKNPFGLTKKTQTKLKTASQVLGTISTISGFFSFVPGIGVFAAAVSLATGIAAAGIDCAVVVDVGGCATDVVGFAPIPGSRLIASSARAGRLSAQSAKTLDKGLEVAGGLYGGTTTTVSWAQTYRDSRRHG